MIILYLWYGFRSPFLLLLFLKTITRIRADRQDYSEFHGLFGERILSILYAKWPGSPARDIIYNKETGRISHAAFSFEGAGKWVPEEWCSRGEKRNYLLYRHKPINLKRFTSTSLSSLREHCFKARVLTLKEQEDIQRDLRSIKVALEARGIGVFLGKRAIFDSIRYGQSAFHDKEIELLLNSRDYARARDILRSLAFQANSEMVLTSADKLSVGLACWPGEEHASNPSKSVLGPPGKKILSNCLINVTFLNISEEMPNAHNCRSFDYRPLQGVLFHFFKNESVKPLTEFCFTRSFDVIEAKDLINILDRNLWLRRRKLMCTRIALPCNLMDDIQPRSYTFNYSKHNIELLLTREKSICRWQSTFVKVLDPHYVYHNEDEFVPGLSGITFH